MLPARPLQQRRVGGVAKKTVNLPRLTLPRDGLGGILGLDRTETTDAATIQLNT